MGKKQPLKERMEWMKFRDEWIKNKELTCFYCGKILLSDAPQNPKSIKDYVFKRKQDIKKELIATVDHVVPVSKGGERFDPENLVVCCNNCNQSKRDLSVEQWQEKKKDEQLKSNKSDENT